MSNATREQIQFDAESLVARVEGFAVGREPAREKKMPGGTTHPDFPARFGGASPIRGRRDRSAVRLLVEERESLKAHTMQKV